MTISYVTRRSRSILVFIPRDPQCINRDMRGRCKQPHDRAVNIFTIPNTVKKKNCYTHSLLVHSCRHSKVKAKAWRSYINFNILPIYDISRDKTQPIQFFRPKYSCPLFFTKILRAEMNYKQTHTHTQELLILCDKIFKNEMKSVFLYKIF